MNTVREHLMAVPPGAVLDTNGLDRLLTDCWSDLEGSSEGGMEASKLQGRMESIDWQPPLLTFVIERHGGTVCGSTRAELQHWEVDVERMTATIVKTGQRQIAPMARPVSVTPLAAGDRRGNHPGPERPAAPMAGKRRRSRRDEPSLPDDIRLQENRRGTAQAAGRTGGGDSGQSRMEEHGTKSVRTIRGRSMT